MRILEGLGSAGRRTILRNNTNNLQPNVKSSSSPQQTGQQVIQSPPQTPSPSSQTTVYQNLPYARANYDYLSKEPGDLTFRKGDIILLRKKIDNNWCLGECNGNHGVFPLSYVQVVVPFPTQIVPQCKALFDFKIFQDQEDGCLVFHKGDLITVMRRVDENWAEGRLGDKIGIFPLAFVELNTVAKSLIKNYPIETQAGATRVVPPAPSTRDDANTTVTPQYMIQPSHYHPKGKALFDFKIGNDEEDNCLVFHKGDVITVTRRVDENWAEGKLGEKIGIFPIGFVELNNVAKLLLKQPLHENQAGPSRVTPPAPGSREDTSSTANPLPQSQPVSLVGLPPAVSDSSSTSLTSPSSTSSSTTINTTSSSSHSSPSSPPPPPPAPNKRHSFGTTVLHNGTKLRLNRHSAEILNLPDGFIPAQSNLNVDVTSVEQHCQLVRHGSQRYRRVNSSDIAPIPGPQLQHSSLQLPASYVALYPYKPQKGDELELKRGAVYTVTERCQDGWFKGTAARGQKAGVFPGNYVAPAKSLPALQAQVKGFYRNGGNTLAGSGSRNGTPPIEPRGLVTYTKPSTNTISSTTNQSTQATVDPAKSAAQVNDSQSAVAVPSNVAIAAVPKLTEKIQSRDKKEKSTVSLMRRLANIKKSKSPPPTPYSLDNPVFEDLSILTPQHVHIRSGSCPNQLLTSASLETSHRIFSPTSSHRSKPRERPSIARIAPRMSTGSSPPSGVEHRKCNSMDNQTMATSQDINSMSTTTRVSSGDELSTSQPEQVQPSHAHEDLLIPPPPPVRPCHADSSGGALTRVSCEASNTNDIEVNIPTGARCHPMEQSCDTKVQTPTRSSGNTHTTGPHKSIGLCKNQSSASHHSRERFRCIVPYPPNSEYELELRLGDIIFVHKKREDGWYKGTQQRTGRTGLFPASFVQSF
ncbi:SH3 domain containing ring finger posh isoform X2 [Rhodnius prolixus]